MYRICLIFILSISLLLVSLSVYSTKPPIGLVLSGGAAWGIAHVGVLEVLLEEGIEVDIIVGTSAGAIIGSLFASGLHPGEIRDLVHGISWTQLLTPQIPDLGFFSTEGIESFMEKHLPVNDFSQLPIRLGVVATDLDTGEEVVITEGSISKGVTASAAIPILYSPVEYGGRLLVDGGLVNNLPVSVARDMGALVVIAVDVSAFKFKNRPTDQVEVLIRSYNILQKASSSADRPEILIQPNLEGISSTELDAYERLMERGREAVRAVLEELKEMKIELEREEW